MAIYKVQQSLSEHGFMMIYDRLKQTLIQTVLTAEVEQMLNGRTKMYVEGQIVRGTLIIAGEARGQAW